jgi:hypothetical protein
MVSGDSFGAGRKTFIAGVSVGLLSSLAVLGWGSLPTAQAESAAEKGSSTAIVQNAADGSQVVYLLDDAERTLCVYQFDPRKGKLKLAAARHLRADQQLLEFNNEEPHVSDIEKLAHSR